MFYFTRANDVVSMNLDTSEASPWERSLNKCYLSQLVSDKDNREEITQYRILEKKNMSRAFPTKCKKILFHWEKKNKIRNKNN